MAANQCDIADLNKMINDIMRESVEAVEEVHLEPQPGEGINVEQGTQPEEEKHALEKGTYMKKAERNSRGGCRSRNSAN